MAIDLTDKIIQPPPNRAKPVRLHPLRRAVQIVLGVLIVVCPPLNVFRLDLRAADFWALGHRYSSQHVIVFFWAAAIFAILLFAVSLIYGRWWCGWACPQTLASDFGDSLKARIAKSFRTSAHPERTGIAQAAWTAAMLVASVVTAALLGSYFIAPPIVRDSLVHPLANPGVAFGTYLFAALMAGNLLFVRRKFCANACPYGQFLSLAGDLKTMTARYLDERDDDCINCGQCVTLCPMNIDIRNGANQMECIGCGECVDACNDVLPRLKQPKPGLIEYRYGLDAETVTARLPFARRVGMWDAKRWFLVVVLVGLSVGFAYAAFLPTATTMTVTPSGDIATKGGELVESYNVAIQSGRPEDASITITSAGDPRVRLLLPQKPVIARRKARTIVAVTLAADKSAMPSGTRAEITLRATDSANPGNLKGVAARTIFYAP
jgi:cytochrome c oxidase accessory protein FixG